MKNAFLFLNLVAIISKGESKLEVPTYSTKSSHFYSIYGFCYSVGFEVSRYFTLSALFLAHDCVKSVAAAALK